MSCTEDRGCEVPTPWGTTHWAVAKDTKIPWTWTMPWTSPFQVSYFYFQSLSHSELSLYILDVNLQEVSHIHLQFETLCAANSNLIWVGEWVSRAGRGSRKVCQKNMDGLSVIFTHPWLVGWVSPWTGDASWSCACWTSEAAARCPPANNSLKRRKIPFSFWRNGEQMLIPFQGPLPWGVSSNPF